MSRLVWFPEPFAAHGGMAAEGVRNVLGRPDLDPLEVLVRETVQNSWDARLGSRQVRFSMEARALTAEEQRSLLTKVFTGLPTSGLELGQVLAEGELDVLFISDRGTVGLQGPWRADASTDGPTDFRDFVFSVGQPPDKELAGGSYGFGKTISYLVSRAYTIVIFTKTEHQGRPQYRLIACALGDQFTLDRKRHTGRHWWGDLKDGVIAPLTGAPAERLAEEIGMPPFDGNDFGTSLAIIAPDLGEGVSDDGARRTRQEAMSFMAAALMRNFWPKTVPPAPGRPAAMKFSLTADGRRVPLPEVNSAPPLPLFRDALASVRAAERHEEVEDALITVREIRSQKPDQHLGWLAVARGVVQNRPQTLGSPSELTGPFRAPARHVALMRQAELVVLYDDGPELPGGGLEWAGVFKAAATVDTAFRESEPPTHDDWRPQLVRDKAQRRSVNVARKKIREALADIFRADVQAPAIEEQMSGRRIAEELGSLLAVPSTGHGGRPPGPERGKSQTARRPKDSQVNDVEVQHVMHGGLPMIRVEFSVEGRVPALVELRPEVAINDGSAIEKDRPEGASLPSVITVWRCEDQRLLQGSPVLAETVGRYAALVSQPAGVAVALDFELSRPEDREVPRNE